MNVLSGDAAQTADLSTAPVLSSRSGSGRTEAFTARANHSGEPGNGCYTFNNTRPCVQTLETCVCECVCVSLLVHHRWQQCSTSAQTTRVRKVQLLHKVKVVLQ